MQIKSLQRLVHKFNANELSAIEKVKKFTNLGDLAKARVYAETAIRNRNDSQHHQKLIARLSGIETQLKTNLSNRSTIFDGNEFTALQQEIGQLENTKESTKITQNDVNQLIEQLQSEINLENRAKEVIQANKLSELNDIEFRLENLRRKF